MEAEWHAGRALTLVEDYQIASPEVRIQALNCLAIAFANQGRLKRGLFQIGAAAKFAQDATVQPALRFLTHWNHAALLHWTGKRAEAETSLRHALADGCSPEQRFLCVHFLEIVLRAHKKTRDAIFCPYCGASACSWDCYVAHYAAEHCLTPSYPGIVLLPDETPVGTGLSRELRLQSFDPPVRLFQESSFVVSSQPRW